MNRRASNTLAITTILCTLAGLTGCSSLIGKSPKIAVQPQNQLVKKGETEVSFSVAVSGSKEVAYQWQFNGSNILRATRATYTIPHPIDFADVGEYRVLVKEADKVNVSDTAYVTAYDTAMPGNVNGGTLCTPVGQFGPLNFSCGTGAFQRGYTPVNAAGQPMLFYGPNANATSQSGLFKNPQTASQSPGSMLVVDTYSAGNGSADTGIRIQNNWVPLATATCNDDSSGGTNPKQSQCQLALSQNAGGINNKNTYRLTILYKIPPGVAPHGKITFNWRYQ